MHSDELLIVSRLLLALLAGGIIGIERAYHGREAGFRTHTLVCVSSSLLMVLMAFQWKLIPPEFIDTVRTDPTRMAQGIMTGIGFLGAGVIIKEGLSVRGLTTAASIWMTASIGIVIGLGFYFPAAIATLITLFVLSLFRWFEKWIPSQKYARFSVNILKSNMGMDEEALLNMLDQLKLKSFDWSYTLRDNGSYIHYEMFIMTKNKQHFTELANRLLRIDSVHGFKIIPS
ncbi:MAG: MgtC/SapB family protein [Gammaproteobacteria bacterium]|nr:MgtC/SapB family protein [Gammaproteobacteria bacterium]